MSKKSIIVCDGCGAEIDTEHRYRMRNPKDRRRLYLETDSIWNGIESISSVITLDFCETCARSLKQTLEKIAKQIDILKGKS